MKSTEWSSPDRTWNPVRGLRLVDPASNIEEHVREALAPLEHALAAATDRAERRTIRREILRRERAIRSALDQAVW